MDDFLNLLSDKRVLVQFIDGSSLTFDHIRRERDAFIGTLNTDDEHKFYFTSDKVVYVRTTA
ncbi:hypothetical protein JOC36_000849 [Weissella uvarum]|nr:hypothetical protein [Weissella uvarum]